MVAVADPAGTRAHDAGSPYLIQYIGDETWMHAAPRAGAANGRDAVEAALVQVRDNLGNGMFRGRWAKATPAEKAVLVAVAQTCDRVGIATTAEVSAALRADTRQWSMARQSLIDKGMIEAVGRGRLRFTMPGFASFIVAHVDEGGHAEAATFESRPAQRPPELPPGPERPGPQRCDGGEPQVTHDLPTTTGGVRAQPTGAVDVGERLGAVIAAQAR